MAKVKISKGEIEKMLIDQLGCESVKWDKGGNAEVELDFNKLKPRVVEKNIERIIVPYIPRYPYYWSVASTRSPALVYRSNTNNTGVGGVTFSTTVEQTEGGN